MPPNGFLLYRTTYPKEVEMLHRTPSAARVSVPPSRAGPSRRICLRVAMLALSVDATAGAQAAKAQGAQLTAVAPSRADSGKAPSDSVVSTKAAAALPKWFDELAVNAFVSTAYEYNSNRPT